MEKPQAFRSNQKSRRLLGVKVEDKVTIITGASKGLGKGIAKLAINEGHQVVLNARTQSALEELKQMAPDRVHVVTGDLTDKTVRQAIVNKSLQLGRIDYLINNAGYGPIGLFENETEEQTELTINLNFLSLVDLTRKRRRDYRLSIDCNLCRNKVCRRRLFKSP